MIAKLKAWFFNLFKSAEHELALESIKNHIDGALAKAFADFAVLDSTRHSNSTAELKKYIAGEICQRYDSLVADAGAAARLMEHSKIIMAMCDHCHLPSRRFSISRIDGKIICSGCAAKGIK